MPSVHAAISPDGKMGFVSIASSAYTLHPDDLTRYWLKDARAMRMPGYLEIWRMVRENGTDWEINPRAHLENDLASAPLYAYPVFTGPLPGGE